jgi:hypothetical protein
MLSRLIQEDTRNRASPLASPAFPAATVGGDGNGFPPANQINGRGPLLPPPLQDPESHPPPPAPWSRHVLPPGTRSRPVSCRRQIMPPSRADPVVLFPGAGGGGAEDCGRSDCGLDRRQGVDHPGRVRERLAKPRRCRRAVHQAYQEAPQGPIFVGYSILSYLCVRLIGQVASIVHLFGLDARLRRSFLSSISTNS